MAEALEDKIKKMLSQKAVLEQELESLSNKKSENCKVSVRLPPFWPDKPAVWFAQVEAQFEIAGIVADRTKYNYVVGQIDHKLAEAQKVRKLLSDEELGDRKPTQFLRHLRSLARDSLSDQGILRQLWLQRLPQSIQAILASQPELTLDKLAELADKIVELSAPAPICAVTHTAGFLAVEKIPTMS
ncbi:uncharacterized protein LOC142986597 [Anticarsia gemmatalis]|uniref:uncharacterized protein LOC142986597 n=1 Tax=Anticarsia gemmatalis TaxID=129554 RepID=UPI003F76CAE6